MRIVRVGLVFLMALAMASLAVAQAQKPGGYHLLRKHVLGGEGGWDYMVLDGRTDPTKEQPRPRPTVVPASFMVLEFGK